MHIHCHHRLFVKFSLALKACPLKGHVLVCLVGAAWLRNIQKRCCYSYCSLTQHFQETFEIKTSRLCRMANPVRRFLSIRKHPPRIQRFPAFLVAALSCSSIQCGRVTEGNVVWDWCFKTLGFLGFLLFSKNPGSLENGSQDKSPLQQSHFSDWTMMMMRFLRVDIPYFLDRQCDSPLISNTNMQNGSQLARPKACLLVL